MIAGGTQVEDARSDLTGLDDCSIALLLAVLEVLYVHLNLMLNV